MHLYAIGFLQKNYQLQNPHGINNSLFEKILIGIQ